MKEICEANPVVEGHTRESFAVDSEVGATADQFSADGGTVGLRIAIRLTSDINVQTDAEDILERRGTVQSSAERQLETESEKADGGVHE